MTVADSRRSQILYLENTKRAQTVAWILYSPGTLRYYSSYSSRYRGFRVRYFIVNPLLQGKKLEQGNRTCIRVGTRGNNGTHRT